LVGGVLPTMSFAAINAETPDTPAVLQGVVESMPGIGTIGTWQVSGIPVQVNAATGISDRMGTPDVGSWVKVQGVPDGNGGLTAQRLKVESMMPVPQLAGALDAYDANSVRVAGVSIARDAKTLVVGTLRTGQRTKVLFSSDSTGQLTAMQIIAQDFEPEMVAFAGTIQQMPVGRVGNWLIAGRTVQVTSLTWMNEYKGSAQVGTQAAVQSIRQANGTLMAIRIIITKALHEGTPNPVHAYTVFHGTVEALPDNTLLGLWQVSGRSVKVTASTYVIGDVSVGDQVFVKGYVQEDDTVMADRIVAQRMNGEMPGEPSHGDQETMFFGQIQNMPAEGLTGDWLIGGRVVHASTQTEFDQSCGAFQTGSWAVVQGKMLDDGSMDAKEIENMCNEGGNGGHHGTATPTPHNPGHGQMPTTTPTPHNPGHGQMPTVTPTPHNPGHGQMPTVTPTPHEPDHGWMPTITPTPHEPDHGWMPTTTPTPHHHGPFGNG